MAILKYTTDGITYASVVNAKVAPMPDPLTMTPAQYIKAARPVEWPNYSYIDLTGQEVCYLTFDYKNQPSEKTRYIQIAVTCTGNYTVSRGRITASGFTADATWVTASGYWLTKSGANTGTDDYVCYQITGSHITAITYPTYTASTGDIYNGTSQQICEIYARLPYLTDLQSLKNRNAKYVTLHDITSQSTNLTYAFSGCTSLVAIDMTGWNTAAATTFINMFDGCLSLIYLDLSVLDFSNVTTLANMCSTCSSLKGVKLTGIDTSKVTSMEGVFRGCSALTSIDLTGLNTSNVTTFAFAFYNSGLQEISMSGLDTSKVTAINSIFQYGNRLEMIDLSGCDFSGVTNMSLAFGNNYVIWEIYPPSNVSVSFYMSNNAGFNVSMLVAWINNLKDLTGLTAQTMTIGSTNKAKLSAEQIAVATAKNWTIA